MTCIGILATIYGGIVDVTIYGVITPVAVQPVDTLIAMYGVMAGPNVFRWV